MKNTHLKEPKEHLKRWTIDDGQLRLVYSATGEPCYLYDEIDGRRIMGGMNGKVWVDAGKWEMYPRVFGLEWRKL